MHNRKDWKIIRHKHEGALYVLKKLSRYHKEVYESLQQHPHPYVVVVKECYEEDSFLYVIEEYVEGTSLATILEENTMFTEKQTIHITLMLCQALHHLHTLSTPIIHRDIKPSNIILNNNQEIKLIDFDVSRVYVEDDTMDTTFLGTQGFAAPEQFGFSQTDARSDIYALGILMNYMLTTLLPQHFLHTGLLRTCIEKCTSLDPKDRYRNIKEVEETLLTILHHRTNSAQIIKKGMRNIPGFRTKQIWKMVVALMMYYLIGEYIIKYTSKKETMIMQILDHGLTIVLMFFLILVWGNVGNIHKRLDFLNSTNKYIRFFGYILYTIIIYFGYEMIIMFLDKLI